MTTRFDAVIKSIAAGADLSHYAAEAAIKELAVNWQAVITDSHGGADNGGNMADIINQDLSDTVRILIGVEAALIAAVPIRPATADFDARNASGDNAITPEFLNALRVYRSPDDVAMTLADQFHVIADRIEEDTASPATADSPAIPEAFKITNQLERALIMLGDLANYVLDDGRGGPKELAKEAVNVINEIRGQRQISPGNG